MYRALGADEEMAEPPAGSVLRQLNYVSPVDFALTNN